MIKAGYDREHNAVIIEFEGNIDGMQAEHFFSDLEKVLPKHGKGFKLLADFTSVQTMEMNVKAEIEEAMELFDAKWVTDILRVLPDPAMDIGFDIMSKAHYSKKPNIHIFRSRKEANAFLSQKT